MKLTLLAIGKHNKGWQFEGFCEYQKRFPKQLAFTLKEVPSANHKASNPETIKTLECEALLKHIKPTDHVIALDARGKAHSTEQLSQRLQQWQQGGKNCIFVIGGAEGLTKEILSRANETWSLSNLTLPHPLVRIIVAEQLYRAKSLLDGHPYHRA